MTDNSARALTLLISHERSGSHLFAELLSSLDDVHVFDEVCNAHAVDPEVRPCSYHSFRQRWSDSHREFWLKPSYVTQVEMVKAYFDHLKSISKEDNTVADIKYGHIHNFEQYWWPIFKRPLLFDACQHHGVNIIHLYRLNIAEAVVSQHLAEARKLWHSWQPNAEEVMQHARRLDVASVIADMEVLSMQVAWIKNHWLAGTTSFEVTYEELTGEVEKGNGLRQRVADFLGVTLRRPFMPTLKKVTTSMECLVENFAELREACFAKGLGKYFERRTPLALSRP